MKFLRNLLILSFITCFQSTTFSQSIGFEVENNLPDIEYDETGFIGRIKIKQRIDKTLNKNSIIVLTGDAGIGKTSLILDKCHEYKRNTNLFDEIKQELLKRFYKPIYIPIITIMCCFLITSSRNKINYNKIKRNTFVLTFFLIVFSETTLRYSTSSSISLIIYFMFPLLVFCFAYITFYKMVKNV